MAARRLTVPADAPERLDAYLVKVLPGYSKQQIQRLLADGKVRVNGKKAKPLRRIMGGEVVELDVAPPAKPPRVAETKQLPLLKVLHETAELAVIDKPAGVVVDDTPDCIVARASTQLDGLNVGGHHEPGIVHRLDKDTSGLLVVAKTLEAQTALVRQLQKRTVKREYLALVHGRVRAGGTVAAPIGRDRRHRTRMAVATGGREAVTHYAIAERYAHATLLACRLETGRTHQIRVHLASLGHPLVGDPTYGGMRRGGTATAGFRRQALHAERLALDHPASGDRMEWTAPLPNDMAALLESLRDG
jgi:23S rRNA pseudouridine1911/1915/1917 synthase